MDSSPEKLKPIAITITWADSKVVRFQFDQRVLWQNEKLLNATTETLICTTIVLPMVEAVRFSTIFINGLSASNILILLARTNAQLTELNQLKEFLLLADTSVYPDCDCNSCEDRDQCRDNEEETKDADLNDWEE